MDVCARQYRICGTVQGVFFRAGTKEEADRLGLRGWVKNCDDGSVEVHAEGTNTQLDALGAWLNRGPANACVDRVDSTPAEPRNYTDFSVVR